MDHLRIDVSGAPEGGFSLYAAAHLAWTLLIATIVAGTIAGIVYSVSESPEYAIIPFGFALATWCWLTIVRPKRKLARVQAYGRSLSAIRSALRVRRGGAQRTRYIWLGLNLIAAVAAGFAATRSAAPYTNALWLLAIFLLLNGLRLWSDKSSSVKTLSAWALIGLVWLGLLAIWGMIFGERQEKDDLTSTVAFVVMMAFAGLALYITRRIAPWAQGTMDEMRKRDPRAPVLFLRSFNDESEPILRERGPSLERVLTDALRPYGPFIGIGRPGELRPAGAARKYFPDDQWQAAVLKLMDEAALIVVVPGLTAGLDWEMRRVGERGRLRKTIFVWPPNERARRFARLRAVLSETPEGTRLAQVDLSTALTLHLAHDWRWAVIGSDYISYAEYQAAVDVAVYGLLCQDRPAP